MHTLVATVRDEHQRFLEDAVKSGRYVSHTEVIATAITEMKAREELRQVRIARLRDEARIGLDELDRGEGTAWNVEAVKAKGRALLPTNE